MTNRRSRLEQLLTELFPSNDELRRFVAGVPHGTDVLPNLPPSTSTSRADFVSAVVEALDCRALINREFFSALSHVRPLARGVLEVAALWNSELSGMKPGTEGRPEVKSCDDALRQTSEPRTGPAPRMQPTLSRWCYSHWPTLLGFSAVSGVTAIGVHYALGNPLAGVYAGQASFALLALGYFLWHDRPSSSDHARLSKRLSALEHSQTKDVELYLAVGASPQDDDPLGPWFHAARAARQQMRKCWLWLWGSWATLYVLSLVRLSLDALSTRQDYAFKIFISLANNTATIAFAVAFCVLTFITAPLEGHEGQEHAHRNYHRSIGLSALVVLLFFTLHMGVVNGLLTASKDDAAAAHQVFEMLGSVFSALATMMLVGRLDSKLIDASWFLLIFLYGYAAIQPSWPALELIGDPVHRNTTPIWYLALFYYVWFGKLVFFSTFAWLFHSGRLDFYFLRSRRLQTTASGHWHRLVGDTGQPR